MRAHARTEVVRAVLFVVLLVASGCDDRRPSGCESGCPAGSVCDPSSGTCVPADGGVVPRDGGIDAGPAVDAGSEVDGGGCGEGLEPCDAGCCAVATGVVFTGRASAPSLAIDSAGRPHVAFLVDSYSLTYARLDGGWDVTNIDDPTYDGVVQAASIALDGSDGVLIAYEANYSLRAARPGSPSWSHEIVFSSAQGFGPGLGPQALVFDSSGVPHIASGQEYYQSTTYGSRIMHFAGEGSTWQREDVESYGDNRIPFPTVAIAGDDTLHTTWVSYYDGVLRYASTASGAWVAEPAFPEGSCCGDAFIALAPDGTPRVAFEGPDGLSLATRDATGTWTVRALTDSLGGGRDATVIGSVAVDSSGTLHYTYGRGGQLVYAVEDASPATATVIGEGVSNHMMVLHDDAPHLVYATETGLYYVTP